MNSILRHGRRIEVEPIEICEAPKNTLLRRRKHFVQFPLPWVERLAGSSSAGTYRVALHLLYRHWKNGGQPFSLGNQTLEKEGVDRYAKWRALDELEQLGLISIERRPRRSPRITVHT
jgi:DNA-binding MarR family transcriptional regulator